jgi:hypothetical protein
LLDCSFQIDDIGDPAPVELEWPERSSGKKGPPRKYITEDGEKLYLDEQPRAQRMSCNKREPVGCGAYQDT